MIFLPYYIWVENNKFLSKKRTGKNSNNFSQCNLNYKKTLQDRTVNIIQVHFLYLGKSNLGGASFRLFRLFRSILHFFSCFFNKLFLRNVSLTWEIYRVFLRIHEKLIDLKETGNNIAEILFNKQDLTVKKIESNNHSKDGKGTRCQVTSGNDYPLVCSVLLCQLKDFFNPTLLFAGQK